MPGVAIQVQGKMGGIGRLSPNTAMNGLSGKAASRLVRSVVVVQCRFLFVVDNSTHLSPSQGSNDQARLAKPGLQTQLCLDGACAVRPRSLLLCALCSLSGQAG